MINFSRNLKGYKWKRVTYENDLKKGYKWKRVTDENDLKKGGFLGLVLG